MRYVVLFMLVSVIGNSQVFKAGITSDGRTVKVQAGGKTYSYGFLSPDGVSIDSYFVASENEYFYMKYEFKSSALSAYFDLVKFKWEDNKIYLKEYVVLNNQVGKWSAIVGLNVDKLVSDFESIETCIWSIETNNENIKVIDGKTEIKTMEIPAEIENELFVDDEVFLRIIGMAKELVKE